MHACMASMRVNEVVFLTSTSHYILNVCTWKTEEIESGKAFLPGGLASLEDDWF